MGTPVNLLLSSQKCQGVPFLPICQNYHFCSGPISVDPICPQPKGALLRGGRLRQHHLHHRQRVLEEAAVAPGGGLHAALLAGACAAGLAGAGQGVRGAPRVARSGREPRGHERLPAARGAGAAAAGAAGRAGGGHGRHQRETARRLHGQPGRGAGGRPREGHAPPYGAGQGGQGPGPALGRAGRARAGASGDPVLRLRPHHGLRQHPAGPLRRPRHHGPHDDLAALRAGAAAGGAAGAPPRGGRLLRLPRGARSRLHGPGRPGPRKGTTVSTNGVTANVVFCWYSR